MELRRKLEKGEAYCFMCATVHGVYHDATCEVYSLGDARYIPTCCACCEAYFSIQLLNVPIQTHMN